MVHTKHQSSKLCGFREEDFLRFSYEKLICPGVWPFLARGHNLDTLCRGPLDDNTYQISKLLAFWVQRRIFLKFSYIILCKTYKPWGGAIFGSGVII